MSKQNDEESIECLCKFLTTIGKTLEEDNTNSKLAHATNNIQFYFEQLQEIVDTQQVSKRIQFEIKNLVELREVNLTDSKKFRWIFMFGFCYLLEQMDSSSKRSRSEKNRRNSP